MKLKHIIKLILGGRLMQFVEFAFTDEVSGLPVNYYIDTLNRRWMANTAWALFRVERGE